MTVLYTPDGEGGIRTLEFAMSFTVESDSRSLPGCLYLTAETEPEFLETRMLKLLLLAVEGPATGYGDKDKDGL